MAGAAAVLVIATAAAGVLHLATANGSSPRGVSAAPSRAVSPPPSPAVSQPVADDPLTIASLQARSYPASTLVPVRSDGDRGGYVNTVVSFQSDGLREYALMSIPDGVRPAGGWPVIILSHGYVDPAAYHTDDNAYVNFISAFARAGYVVIKPDYRGNGESQGVPEGGHLSPVYAYDVLNLVSTLKADGRIDSSRIGLFGHSLGGHEVLRAMVVSKDIKAVVILAGVVGSFYDLFYNWPRTPASMVTPVAVQVTVEDTVIATYGTPMGDPAFWNSASAINYVGATTAAVQVDQDVDDTVVPKVFSDHLAAALQAAGKTVEYNLYPGDDHQFSRNRAAILTSTVAFYRAHL